MDDERSRKFHWVDPHPALDVARKVGGLEYTRRSCAVRYHPHQYANSSASASCSRSQSRSGIEFDSAEYHHNVIGSLHGGITCTLSIPPRASRCIRRFPPTTDSQRNS